MRPFKRAVLVPTTLVLALALALAYLLHFTNQTDEDGSLEVGTLRVEDSSASKNTRSNASLDSAHEVSAENGNNTSNAAITRTTLTVQVRDDLGKPIEGAFVEFVKTRAKGHLRNPIDYGYTDNLGQFQAQIPIQKILVIVNRDRASKKTHTEESERLVLARKPEQFLAIELDRSAGRLIVRAVTEDGEPVRNALFKAFEQGGKFSFSARTDKFGEATFERLSTGTALLVAKFSSEKPKVSAPKSRRIEITQDSVSAVNYVLRRYGQLRITTRIVGNFPIEQVDIRVHFSGTTTNEGYRFLDCAMTAPEEKTINIPPGTYDVAALCKLDGNPILVKLSASKMKVVQGKLANLEITAIMKGHKLVGKIIDAQGEPVSGISINGKVTPTGSSESIATLTAKSDYDGQFTFPSLPEGTIELAAQVNSIRSYVESRKHASYPKSQRRVEVVSTISDQVIITLQRGFTAHVELTSVAAPGCTLELKGHPYGRMRVIGTRKSFFFRNMFLGTYQLTLRSKKGAILRQRQVDFGSLADGQYTFEIKL